MTTPKKQPKSKEMREHLWQMAQLVLLLFLISLSMILIIDVQRIQGASRVVNYAGITRGMPQRIVKLETIGKPNDELIDYVDEIFDGLMMGGGEHDLTLIDDADYRGKLKVLSKAWGVLKGEIYRARELGIDQTDLIGMSETYYYLADETVASVEWYAEKHASHVSGLEYGMLASVGIMLLMLFGRTWEAIRLVRQNRELRRSAYIDLHTGLPNKSRCEEWLNRPEELTVPTCVMMCDLNELKKVNDSLGHVAGDTLIRNFANILRTTVPPQHFVGRYGGDEFVVVLQNVNEMDVVKLVGSIRESCARFNTFGEQAHMDFGCGFAHSSGYKHCTLRTLLEKADQLMYIDKAARKRR